MTHSRVSFMSCGYTKQNDFHEFLIVLPDNYYNYICFWKSEYENILSQRNHFPGTLHIKYETDLRNDTTGDFMIKDIVQFKTLYIKLPKENIYVDSHKYQDDLFDSKFNELLNIFATLNAKYVDFYFENMDEHMNQLSTCTSILKSSSVSTIEAGQNILSKHITQSKRRMRVEYSQPDSDLDPAKFRNVRAFYYLPKEFGWRNLVKSRMENNVTTQEYTYKYSESVSFSAEFYNCLKQLDIKFKMASEKYNEVKIQYFIEYWAKPSDPKHVQFSKYMAESEEAVKSIESKRTITNIEEDEFSMSQFLFDYINPMKLFTTYHWNEE